MELTHSFTVPVDRDTAWAAFQDIASIAECFPGASVSSVEGDAFQGGVKVKLGPIALQYAGSGEFVARDAAAYTFAVKAKGRDKRGNGTAGADVTASFAEEGSSATRVQVVTALQITGKPAQFGRGVIQDVSDKLLGQFVECLESKIVPAEPAPAAPATEVGAAGGAAAVGDVGPGEEGVAAAGAPARAGGGEPSAAAGAVGEPVSIPPAVQSGAPPGRDDALDLGATVLPVILRTYWKPLTAVALALVLLVWRLRRRS